MDDDLDLPPPSPAAAQRGRKHRRPRDTDDGDEPRQPYRGDLEQEHRKFLIWMFGLAILVLVLMVVLNNYVDFATDGGI